MYQLRNRGVKTAAKEIDGLIEMFKLLSGIQLGDNEQSSRALSFNRQKASNLHITSLWEGGYSYHILVYPHILEVLTPRSKILR